MLSPTFCCSFIHDIKIHCRRRGGRGARAQEQEQEQRQSKVSRNEEDECRPLSSPAALRVPAMNELFAQSKVESHYTIVALTSFQRTELARVSPLSLVHNAKLSLADGLSDCKTAQLLPWICPFLIYLHRCHRGNPGAPDWSLTGKRGCAAPINCALRAHA